MGDFDGIEQASSGEKTPPVAVGRYLFEVSKLKMFTSPIKGRMFIAEFHTLESAGTGANEVGSTCSWVVKMALPNAKGNIKGFAAALLGEPEAQVSSKDCDELVAVDNPARGQKVRCEAFLIKTRAGNDFTKLHFAPAA